MRGVLPLKLLGACFFAFGLVTLFRRTGQTSNNSSYPLDADAGGTVRPFKSAQLEVMFAMIGRDVAQELPYILRNIERLGERFAVAHVVLVENDSTDSSKADFTTWAAGYVSRQKSKQRSVPIVELVSFTHPGRQKDLQTLAVARNKYLDLLGRDARFHGVQYLIVADADMCFPWEVDRIIKVIDGLLPFSGSQWSALFSNGACGWYSKAPLANPREEVKCNAPGGIPIYCDLFALRDTAGALHRMQQTSVFLVPDSCDLSSMNNQSAGTMECKFIGGQAVIPVQAAFGGWGMYRADIFRPLSGGGNDSGDALGGAHEDADASGGCRHMEVEGACEHVSLSDCIRNRRNGTQLLATGLVVNWEGCELQTNTSKCLWELSRSIAERKGSG